MNASEPIPTIPFPSNKIPVSKPSDEPLVYLNKDFICDSKYNHWIEEDGKPLPGSSPMIMARKTVAEMLKQAETLLPKGYRFKIFDAYRPIIVQQALWDHFRAIKAKEHPDMTNAEIDKITSFCVSYPSYNILEPSLHNTGGAVDLTIIDSDGNELDMGCGFDDFTDKAWTNHFEPAYADYEQNEIVMSNRRLLYNVMISVGFTNLPSEWWHYDYGDDKWAQITHSEPIYEGILDTNVRNSIPYHHFDQIRKLDAFQRKYT